MRVRLPRVSTWASLLVPLLFPVAACQQVRDHFVVDDFAGAKILMDIGGVAATPPGHHVELWARDASDDESAQQDIIRLLSGDGQRQPDRTVCPAGTTCIRAAYAFLPAVDLDDGCAIDDQGNLITSPDFLVHGTPQGTDYAMATVARIHQLTDEASSPLLVLAAWDDGSPLRPSASAQAMETPPVTADVRKQRCDEYWAKSPSAYDGNPQQLTAPLHGTLFGTVDFTSLDPPQVLGGITVTTDYSLRDLRELWLTDATAGVEALDPTETDCRAHADTCRGTVLLDGNDPAVAAGALRLNLVSAGASPGSGAASVEIALDQTSESF